MVKNIYHCLEKKEIVDGRLHCRWEQTNFFVLHSHDFWEMTIGIHGNSQHDINETSVILKPQSAVLITPKHLHKIQPCPKENNHLNIVISDSFMKSCCDHFSPTLYDEFLQMPVIPLYLSNGQFSVIKDFQAKMQILPITDPKKEVIQRMLLSYLIELVYNNNFIIKSFVITQQS